MIYLILKCVELGSDFILRYSGFPGCSFIQPGIYYITLVFSNAY